MARERIITSFTSLEVVPDRDNPNNPDNGFYVPRLTEHQRDNIDLVSDSRGCIIFNTTAGHLETVVVSKEPVWVPIATSGGDPIFNGAQVNHNLSVGELTTTGTLLVNEKTTTNTLLVKKNIRGLLSGDITVTLGGGAGGPESTYTIGGSEMCGEFTLTVAEQPTFTETMIATFTLPGPSAVIQAVPIFAPADLATALIVAGQTIYMTAAGGLMKMYIAPTHQLEAGKTYKWHYHILVNDLQQPT